MEPYDKFLRQYRKNIQMMLPIYEKKEKEYLDGLFNNIKDYLEDNPDMTQEQFLEKFGSPADVAATYISCADNDYLLKKLQKNRILKKGICSILLLLIIFSILISSIMYATYLDAKNHNIHSIETTIEYINPADYAEPENLQ